MIRFDVVLLVHNEVKTIGTLIHSVLNEQFDNGYQLSELIVVEDGSTDGTTQLLKQLSETNEKIYLIQSSDRRGYVNAFITGALKTTSDIVVFSDTSNKYKSSDIKQLLNELKFADLVIGRRAYLQDPLYRDFLRIGLNLLATILFFRVALDIDSPQRVYRKRLLDHLLIDLDQVKYLINLELTLKAIKTKKTIRYVSIFYTGRVDGKSRGLPLRKIPFAILDSIKSLLRNV